MRSSLAVLVCALLPLCVQGATAAPTCGTKCGSERWVVKALADRDAGRVSLRPEPATVDGVRRFARPRSLPVDRRTAPVEMKTFTIKAVLVGYKREDDRDFHLVIADPSNRRLTFVAEIADPACSRVCESLANAQIRAVRAKFVERFGKPRAKLKRVNIPVTITGAGFFDFRHRQTGLAPNGFELHPVLAIDFGD